MTPSILKPLFDTWRKENRSFCITSDNFNKSNALIESQRGGGQILSFRYPFHNALASKDYWIEKHNFEGKVPEYIDKQSIEEISAWLYSQNKPSNISLQLTTYCNYYCPMCVWHGNHEFMHNYYQENPTLKRVHMPLEKAKLTVDKILDYGIKDLNLTCEGEFFLYPHWEEILEYITKKDIKITFTSNGSLITKELVEQKLKHLNVAEVCISVDTLNFETFKKLRSDKEKFFHNTINAPILLHEAGIYTQVNFIRQRINDHELDDVLKKYQSIVDQICVCDEILYQEMSYQGDSNENYPLSLCEGFGEYIIQTDGNVVACCFMSTHPKILKEHAPNIHEKSLETCIETLKDSFFKTKLNNHCLFCPSYRSNMIDKHSMAIHHGYFVLKNKMVTRHYKIPQKLMNLSEDVLLFMYQNHIVTQMKQAGIL